MFEGLSTELLGAAIYDLGRGGLKHLTQREWVQKFLKKYDLKGEQHDFAARYVEALVELSMQNKPSEVLNFFRESSISRTFYNYYYGEPEFRGNDTLQEQELRHCVVALKVGDDIKNANIDHWAEVQNFWKIFRQKVQESRAVKEVETEQQLQELLTIFSGFRPGDEKKIPHLLTQLPFIPEQFRGRDGELRYIYQHLFASNDNLLLLVNGEGGVGKTSLASKYFYTYKQDYAHVAWVFSEKNLGSALLQLAIPLGLQFDEKADTEKRLHVLTEAMFGLKKPCLLIIDNANELDELRQYLPLLQRCSNFHLLFTTRISNFPQVAFYKIEPLPQELALQVFKSHYSVFATNEENLFYDIYQAVNGNTLVLELLAKNLNHFNNHLKKRYLLADLCHDLNQGLLQLSKTSTVDVRYQAKGKGLRSEKIEVILAAMYDLGDLSPAESQLLSVFAVLPAESILFKWLEILLSDWGALDQDLLTLAQKGWIEYHEDSQSFKCNPLVQEVVRLKQKDFLLSHCRVVINGLCIHLDEEHRYLNNYQHSSLFVRYGESLVTALLVVDVDSNLGILLQNIGGFYAETGDLLKALATYGRMQQVQSSILENDQNNPNLKNDLAISYEKLGTTLQNLGNSLEALNFFEQYNELEKELYAAYPQNASFKNGLATSYEKLGSTHQNRGNLLHALAFFEQCNELDKELYTAYPQNASFKNGLATSYEKLGSTHRNLGNFLKALTFFEQYNELEKELYTAYPQNASFKNGLAISYEKLGSTYRDLENFPRALAFFERYNELAKELYTTYPQNVSFKNGLAISYLKLGTFYQDEQDDHKARAYFQQCYELWKELSEAYPAYVEFNKSYAIAKNILDDL